jgi:hypothetical protein
MEERQRQLDTAVSNCQASQTATHSTLAHCVRLLLAPAMLVGAVLLGGLQIRTFVISAGIPAMHTVPSINEVSAGDIFVSQKAAEMLHEDVMPPAAPSTKGPGDSSFQGNSSDNLQSDHVSFVLQSYSHGDLREPELRVDDNAEMEVSLTTRLLDYFPHAVCEDWSKQAQTNNLEQLVNVFKDDKTTEASILSQLRPAGIAADQIPGDDEGSLPASLPADADAQVLTYAQEHTTDALSVLESSQGSRISPGIRSVLMPLRSCTLVMDVTMSAMATVLAWIFSPPTTLHPLVTVAAYMITAVLLAFIASGMASLILPGKSNENKTPKTPFLPGPTPHELWLCGDQSSETVRHPEFASGQQNLVSPCMSGPGAQEQASGRMTPPYLCSHAVNCSSPRPSGSKPFVAGEDVSNDAKQITEASSDAPKDGSSHDRIEYGDSSGAVQQPIQAADVLARNTEQVTLLNLDMPNYAKSGAFRCS